MRPALEAEPSSFLVGFLSAAPGQELPQARFCCWCESSDWLLTPARLNTGARRLWGPQRELPANCPAEAAPAPAFAHSVGLAWALTFSGLVLSVVFARSSPRLWLRAAPPLGPRLQAAGCTALPPAWGTLALSLQPGQAVPARSGAWRGATAAGGDGLCRRLRGEH